MRFPPQVLDEIRARLPVSGLVARKVPLKRAGREWSGLSPFKAEKSPSFFVNDQKGFYHCFASGEHGDVFKWLMVTEGMTFPEAVERLAQLAGVTIPKNERISQEQQDGHARLLFLVEAAAKFYQEALPKSKMCCEYIERRGLTSTTVETFRLGYAPSDRSALKQHLTSKGFTPAEMNVSGMMIHGDDIKVPFDRFRHRLMFPIQDHKGRVIAFGGRALDADQTPKYLNSPETPLFHKGNVLFNMHRARASAHETKTLIVVEGYMDVVALAEAGFREAVAPLGTALTEEQVQRIWRVADTPTLLFDGDSAGRKAAHRAIDTALPNVQSGQSLAFASLPDGMDPDDMVRKRGPEALRQVLATAKPMFEVLFDREWNADTWSTPEKRAKLQAIFREITRKIADRVVREHYETSITQRLGEYWRLNGAKGMFMRKAPAQQQPTEHEPRPWNHPETMLIAVLLQHPWLIGDHAEAIAGMTILNPDLERLRDLALSIAAIDEELQPDRLRDLLVKEGHAETLATIEMIAGQGGGAEDRQAIQVQWIADLDNHARVTGLKQQLADARHEWSRTGSAEVFERMEGVWKELQSMRDGSENNQRKQ